MLLFWALYAIDRNISFRLGQPPALQDYDIDTPVMLDNDGRHPSAKEFIKFWVDCGKVQGTICTQLYGPAASHKSDLDRALLAERLAGELEQIYLRKCEANAAFLSSTFGQEKPAGQTDAWTHSDGINYYSTL